MNSEINCGLCCSSSEVSSNRKSNNFFIWLMKHVLISERNAYKHAQIWTRSKRTKNINMIKQFNEIHYYMSQLVCNIQKYCSHRKTRAIFIDMQDNGFISEEKKHIMRYIFNKTQSHYMALNKFGYFLNYKKRVVGPTIDFEFNLIDKCSCINIYQENVEYIFSVKDIIRILMNALTFFDDSTDMYFFPRATRPKNPYINMEFNDAALFEIFYQLKTTCKARIPFLLECFLRSEFSLKMLDLLFGNVLRRCQIDYYIRDMSDSKLRIYGEDMLTYLYNQGAINEKITIKENYSTSKFVNYMRRYIILYIRYLNTFDIMESESYRFKMLEEVIPFLKKNPKIGRTTITRKSVVVERMLQSYYVAVD